MPTARPVRSSKRLAMVAATPVYTVRQPALGTCQGTIRLRPKTPRHPHDELGDLPRAALKARPQPRRSTSSARPEVANTGTTVGARSAGNARPAARLADHTAC